MMIPRNLILFASNMCSNRKLIGVRETCERGLDTFTFKILAVILLLTGSSDSSASDYNADGRGFTPQTRRPRPDARSKAHPALMGTGF